MFVSEDIEWDGGTLALLKLMVEGADNDSKNRREGGLRNLLSIPLLFYPILSEKGNGPMSSTGHCPFRDGYSKGF